MCPFINLFIENSYVTYKELRKNYNNTSSVNFDQTI